MENGGTHVHVVVVVDDDDDDYYGNEGGGRSGSIAKVRAEETS